MKTFCPNCSQEVEVPDNAAGSSVPCPACGTAFTPEEPKTCRHCGALNPKHATKCEKCGKSIISIGIRKPGAAVSAPATAAAPAEPEKTEEPKAERPKIAIRKPGAAAAAAPAGSEKAEAAPTEERPKIALRKPGAAGAAPAPAAPAAGGPPKLELSIPKKPAAAPAAGGPPKLNLTPPAAPAAGGPPKLNLTPPAAPAAGGPPKLGLSIPKKPAAAAAPAAPAAGGPPKLNLTPSAASAAPGKKPEAPAAGTEEKKPKEKVPLSDEAKKRIRIAVLAVVGIVVLGIAGAVVYFMLGDPSDPQKQLAEAMKGMESGNSEKAVRLLEKSAKQGNRQAAARLGDMYLKGDGVPEDLSKAVELFRSAEGEPLAHFRLGQLYSEGKGVDKDLKEAVKHYEAAVKAGYAEAELEYARCFAEGLGVKKDERKALPWRKKQADEGDPEAQIDMARYHINGVFTQYSPDDAVRYLTLAAKQGNRTARYRLAELTLKGIGTKKSEKDAGAEFEKIYQEIARMPADQKPSDADLIIAAKCLIRGYDGKTTDPAQAGTLLKGPATRNDPEAVMILYYLTKDEAAKKALLKKALSLNIPEAKEITAIRIAAGDPGKADRLLKEAQEQGSLSAFAAAAAIHLKKDPARAFEESKYAWERQDPLGSLIYAECLESGLGGAGKDPAKALEIYWGLVSSDTPVRAQAHAKLTGLFRKKEFQAELKKRFQDRLQNGTPEEKQAILKMQANLYLIGAGLPKSTSKAVDCLWKAQAFDELIQLAENGVETKKIISLFLKNEKNISDPGIFFALADVLISGKEGVRADPVKGARLLKKAAAAGHPQAAYEMGRLCAQEKAFDLPGPDAVRPETKIEKSPDEALSYFRQAAEAGIPDAQYRYARAILKAKKLPEGVKNKNAEAGAWLKKAAGEKHVPALFLYTMVRLGSGKVAKKELPGLLQNIRSAAEAGYLPAIFAMADIAAAAGKSEDADAWYEKAAEAKFVPALIQLKRKKKNSALIREAAAAGYLPAQAEEALSLLKKEKKDNSGKKSEARRKLARLVDRGYSVCMNELGVAAMYDGDKKEALKNFEEAAENGSAFARFNLGVYTFREENLGGGNYQNVKDILVKLRAEHPDFSKIPEGVDKELDRLMKLEVQFKKLNKKHKAIIKSLRPGSSPDAKKDAEKCKQEIDKMRDELDSVTASLKKKLDWVLEPNYSAFFRKAPPEIRYPWVPAVDLAPLKAAYK